MSFSLEDDLEDDSYTPELQSKNLAQPAEQVFQSWAHQLPAYHFSLRRFSENVGAMLAMGMGTGKTKVAIDLAVNLGDRLVLVICPVSVLGVWRREVKVHSPKSNVLILDDSIKAKKGSSATEQKRKKAEAFCLARKHSDDTKPWFIVVNYDTARLSAFANWALRQQWSMGILDESHRAKQPGGVTGKFIGRLRLCCVHRLELTGTPMNSPADLFSQFRFLDIHIFGDSYFRFKRRFAIIGFFKEIVGWRNREELQIKFHTAAIVISSDVLDLPPTLHLEREFCLPPRVQDIYESLWDDLITEVERGVCTADNALVKLLRCQQITCGYLPLDDDSDPFDDVINKPSREVVELHDNKIKLLKEIIRDGNPKDPIIVFCRFRYDLDQIRKAVESLEDIGHSYGEISGRQKDLTPDATLPDGPSVFGVQIQSGGVGVDFTKAASAVLYSIDYSLNNYDQMLKRLDRPGQTRSVRYYHLIAEDTVDRLIMSSLQSKRNVVETILESVAYGNIGREIRRNENEN